MAVGLPDASDWRRVWERIIRRVFRAIWHGQRMTDKTLVTFLVEAQRILDNVHLYH